MCYFLKIWGTFTLYTLVHCYGAMKSPFTLDYSGTDKFQGPSEEKQWGEHVKGIVAGFYVFDNDTALLAWTHSSKLQPILPLLSHVCVKLLPPLELSLSWVTLTIKII